MTLTRREAFASLALALAAAHVDAQEQAPQQAGGGPVFKHDLPNVSLDGWEVTMSHVNYAPGRVGQPHQHQGFLFAYVLEGEVVAQVLGAGVSDEVKTYKPGEVFYEPMGSTHQVSKNASATKPAKLLAINLRKKA